MPLNSDLTNRFLNNVRTHVPGALDPVMKLEMFNAARELLDFSEIWKEKIEFDTAADRTDYFLAAPAEIARLHRLADANDIPVKAAMAEPATIILAAAPTAPGRLTAEVSLLADATDPDDFPEMPDWIVSKYFDYLVSGVIGRLMAHPAKPYSNPALATVHLRRFNNGKAIAKKDAKHKNLYGGQAWRFPFPAGRK